MVNREELLKRVESQVRKQLARPDMKLIAAVHTRDSIINVTNILYERLEEWVTLHDIKIKGRSLPDRVRSVEKQITSLPKGDQKVLAELIERIKDMMMYRKMLNEYIDRLTDDCCPNVKHLVGSDLAAQLITLAGGVERLALFPASTVQLLGAEKALFRHIKTGAKPPKYGVLFKHPKVIHAPRKKKGKIARIIAAHVSIAARADAFTGNWIGDRLKEDMEKRIREVLGEKEGKK